VVEQADEERENYQGGETAILKILIACEFSGIVRDAFSKKGHDVISCDLLPTEKPGNHYQGDVMDIIGNGFDMMIAHPPCTYLSYAANRVWNNPGRIEKRDKAVEFFMALYNADIEKICIENPTGYINTIFRKPDQIIHPYFFGERQMKRTCLWLKNLPLLDHHSEDNLFSKKTHTDKPRPIYISQGKKTKGKKEYFTTASNFKGKNRAIERSRTFQSIAEAMATQWNF